jgi:hypothetical protein
MRISGTGIAVEIEIGFRRTSIKRWPMHTVGPILLPRQVD